MHQLWKLLMDEPFLLIILVGWILGGIASIKKRSQQQARRQGMPNPAPAPKPRPGPTKEQVEAELRRILTQRTQRPSPQQARQQPARSQPASQPKPTPRAQQAQPQRTQLQPTPSLGELQVNVGNKLGDDIRSRQQPGSKAVGEHELGDLGGRSHARSRTATQRQAAGIVDLHDLPRAIVLMEVLGKPLALRGE